MSFIIFHRNHPSRLHHHVERLSRSKGLTVIVGAGASIEVGLPSWSDFTRRALLDAAAVKYPDSDQHVQWVERILASDDNPGCLTLVKWILSQASEQGLCNQHTDEPLTFEAQLKHWLYGEELEHADVEPGPIASAIAELYAQFRGAMAIATTNYDLLLEKALKRRRDLNVRPRPRSELLPTSTEAGVVAVAHLHGYLTPLRHRRSSKLVATEAEYHRARDLNSWQNSYLRSALKNTSCLFVGTSLLDEDIREFIFHHAQGRHKPLVVFSRETDRQLPTEMQEGLEEDIRGRWLESRVEVASVRYFGDVSTLLNEIAFARSLRQSRRCDYENLFDRCARWIDWFETHVLQTGNSEQFFMNQFWWAEAMRAFVVNAEEQVRSHNPDFELEDVVASLWVTNREGRGMRRWITSDRASINPRTVDEFSFDDDSWNPPAILARRANSPYTRDGEKEVPSRWPMTASIPVNMPGAVGDSLPVAALTVGVRGGCYTPDALVKMAELVAARIKDAIALEAVDEGG